MKARCGDLVELSNGTTARIERTIYGLADNSTRHDVRRLPGLPLVRVSEHEVIGIVEHGAHAYLKPDARRVPPSECKRGYCYRCGIKKASHP